MLSFLDKSANTSRRHSVTTLFHTTTNEVTCSFPAPSPQAQSASNIHLLPKSLISIWKGPLKWHEPKKDSKMGARLRVSRKAAQQPAPKKGLASFSLTPSSIQDGKHGIQNPLLLLLQGRALKNIQLHQEFQEGKNCRTSL